MSDKLIFKFVNRLIKESFMKFTIGTLASHYNLDYSSAQFLLSEGQRLNIIRANIMDGSFTVAKDFDAAGRLAKGNVTEEYKVGDQVSVVRDGKVYSGRVKAYNKGKAKIDFGKNRPSKVKDEDEFGDDEIAKNECFEYTKNVEVVEGEFKKDKDAETYTLKIGDVEIPIALQQPPEMVGIEDAMRALNVFKKLYGVQFEWKYCNEEEEWYLVVYAVGEELDKTALKKTPFKAVKKEAALPKE